MGRIRTGIACAFLATVCQTHAANDPTRFSLEELMSLTVFGGAKYDQRLSDVASATSVITREEIRVFGWRTLGQALASLPGIHTTYDRQYSYLGTRGFGLPGDYNTRVLILVNGNRINDSVYDQGPVGWDFPLDLNLVERIEFIPGPGGAVYGLNAMLGVVNVITRNGSDGRGGELIASWENAQHASETSVIFGRKLDNDIDLLLSASSRNSRGQDLLLDFGQQGSGVAVGLDGESVRRVFTRLGGGSWSLDVLHGDRVKNDPTASYQTKPLMNGQYSGDRYTMINLQYQNSYYSDSLQFTGRLFAGNYLYSSRLFYPDGAEFEMPGTAEWRGLELRWVSSAVPDHKMMIGLEHQNNTRGEQSNWDIGNPANNLSIQTTGHWTGLYLQDDWKLTADMVAIYGVRFDARKGDESKFSPRVGLVWKLSDATTVKGLLGRAFRAPNAYERDYHDGVSIAANPVLRGESIETAELVAEHRLDLNTRVKASLYQWRIKDIITLGTDPASDPSRPLSQYQTGQEVKTKGLELSVDRTWHGGSRLRGSWSLQQSAYHDGTAVLNSPERLFKLLLSTPMPWPGVNLGYELYYDSSRLTLNGSRLASQSVSNLFLRWVPPVRGWEFGLGISNLFDKRYEQPASDTNWQNALAQDGRSVRVLANYRFE